MIIGIGIAIGVAVLIGLWFAGRAMGAAQDPPTVLSPGGTTSDDCRTACSNWDSARQMQCNAKADEEAARGRADGIRNELLTTIAGAIALAAAAVAAFAGAAAATASVFGALAAPALIILGISLVTAAVAATAAADVLAGQLNAAESDASAKAMARQSWDTAVAAARAKVNAQCSMDEANSCLSRAAPC